MQKYLVMHKFRSFGKTFLRGQIVEETELRSPRLRVSEGKAVPIKDIVDNSKPDEKDAVSSDQGLDEGTKPDSKDLVPPQEPDKTNIKPLFTLK